MYNIDIHNNMIAIYIRDFYDSNTESHFSPLTINPIQFKNIF